MIIITLGLPGAGKGTIARKLRDTYGFSVLATGDLIRKEIFSNSELGLRIKSQVDKGDFIEDQIVIDMVKPHIQNKRDIILDGFPRNIIQTNALEQILEDNGKKIDLVLYFDSDAEQDTKRLAARRTCPSCHAVFNTIIHPPKQEGICDHCGEALIWREDDRKETLTHKFNVFRQKTKPLKSFYEKKGLVTIIDATKSTMDIYYDVLASSNKFTERTF